MNTPQPSASPNSELAILLRGGDLPGSANAYGRLIANKGLFSALRQYGSFDTIHWLMARGDRPAEAVLERLRQALGPGNCRDQLSSPLSSEAPIQAGTLLHGSAYVSAAAWLRRHNDQERRYSLVGTFFGIAVAEVREPMLGSLLAPLHPWDALICSSPTVQSAVRTMLDNMGAYLAERTGAQTLPRPQLPVIPIGVDAPALAARRADAEARRSLRDQLSIGDDAIAVLWVGRLSWFDKAFPQPMLLALEQAAATSSVPVHFVMAGYFCDEAVNRPRFEEAARVHAPRVQLHLLDGNDPQLVAQCWAAADIFLSLSDTILETFGQAPVEAMAAGLPVVLSDWNGYRSLLRHGEEGLLIPSLAAPAGGNGDWLALTQTMGMTNQRSYGGSVAQGVAVHVGQAAAALSALINSAELRQRLGETGRRRAVSSFDWPVVVAAHQALFAELAERRQHEQQDAQAITPRQLRLPPLGNDPFADFGSYASSQLDDDRVLRCTSLQLANKDLPLEACALDGLLPGLRGTAQENQQLLLHLEAAGACRVGELLVSFPRRRWPFLRMSLVWLAKLGRIDWDHDDAIGAGASDVNGTKWSQLR
jgi:glycosyltransferase involved in cell wall biosynthesis